jgi:hypothetical protein
MTPDTKHRLLAFSWYGKIGWLWLHRLDRVWNLGCLMFDVFHDFLR